MKSLSLLLITGVLMAGLAMPAFAKRRVVSGLPVCSFKTIQALTEQQANKDTNRAFYQQHPALAQELNDYVSRQLNTVNQQWKTLDKGEQIGLVYVQVDILPNGSLSNAALKCTTGNARVDQMALWAVQRSNPFEPWPSAYRARTPAKTLKVGITFEMGGSLTPPDGVFPKNKKGGVEIIPPQP